MTNDDAILTDEERIFRALTDENGAATETIATAESLTGGGVAARIVRVAGSSAYMLGGIVAYSNEAKHKLLGVPADVLENPGAVSEICAIAMADGARQAFGATYAVATTGIAGPAGATARKPVGLVYTAVATPEETIAQEHHFSGDRAEITLASVNAALRLLVEAIERRA